MISWKSGAGWWSVDDQPEWEDDGHEVGGETNEAADEAAVEAEDGGVVDVHDHGPDQLHHGVDQGDHCQHHPGDQKARFALKVKLSKNGLGFGWF